MEYKCPACGIKKNKIETIKIEYSKEEITVFKCVDCGAVAYTEIKRPEGWVLKKKRGAGEIRFSENERRNFAAILLSMQEVQINLLAAIAGASGVNEEEVEEIKKYSILEEMKFKVDIGEGDETKPYGEND
jgi:uncharacterized Zn finger protein